MVTRAERLAQQEAKAKAKRDKEEAVYRTKQKARLAEEKRLRRKRHVLVGTLADTPGCSCSAMRTWRACLPPSHH